MKKDNISVLVERSEQLRFKLDEEDKEINKPGKVVPWYSDTLRLYCVSQRKLKEAWKKEIKKITK